MFVDLSTSQYIPFGKMLNHLYYSNKTLLALAPGKSGYPHNGGEHTLSLNGEAGDITAFLDLVLAAYPAVVKEIVAIKDAIVLSDGRTTVYAKKLFSQRICDYHETYTYVEQDSMVHFYPVAGFAYKEFAAQAIFHLMLLQDEDVPYSGIVHFDAFMAVQIYSTDSITDYTKRVYEVQCEIAANQVDVEE